MLAFLLTAWTAFSPAATLVGLSGIALIAVALLGLTVLPDALKKVVIALGVALLVGASLYQAGQAKGVALQAEVEASKALAAETKRAELAEATIAADRAQASKDRTAALADRAKLRKLLDDAQKHQDGARECLSRDLSRRLRDL